MNQQPLAHLPLILYHSGNSAQRVWVSYQGLPSIGGSLFLQLGESAIFFPDVENLQIKTEWTNMIYSQPKFIELILNLTLKNFKTSP